MSEIHGQNCQENRQPNHSSRADETRRITRIWSWYRRHRSAKLRDVLINYYLALVKRHAQKMHTRVPACVSLDELEAAGMMGLLECIDTFDPAKASFETFSAQRIRGSMRDEMRGMDWASRSMRTWQRKVAEAEQAAERDLGRPPTDKELAQRLGIGEAKLKSVLQKSRGAMFVPLGGEFRGEGDGSAGGFGAGFGYGCGPLADERALDPAREAQKAVLRDEVTRGLSRAERLIIILYYFEGFSLREIGDTLDLSESRICQMRGSILARLRARLTPADLLAA